MLKMLIAVLVISLSSTALADWKENFEIRNNQVVKVVSCTNGVSYFVPITVDDLRKGFVVTDKKGNRYHVKPSTKRIWFGNKDEVFDALVVTNDSGKVVEHIILDFDKELGYVSSQHFPIQRAESREGDEELASSTEVVTGLMRTEHYDPKTGRVFKVWHFVRNTRISTEPREHTPNPARRFEYGIE